MIQIKQHKGSFTHPQPVADSTMATADIGTCLTLQKRSDLSQYTAEHTPHCSLFEWALSHGLNVKFTFLHVVLV